MEGIEGNEMAFLQVHIGNKKSLLNIWDSEGKELKRLKKQTKTKQEQGFHRILVHI